MGTGPGKEIYKTVRLRFSLLLNELNIKELPKYHQNSICSLKQSSQILISTSKVLLIYPFFMYNIFCIFIDWIDFGRFHEKAFYFDWFCIIGGH